jgi:hypothetical protein
MQIITREDLPLQEYGSTAIYILHAKIDIGNISILSNSSAQCHKIKGANEMAHKVMSDE